MILKRLKLIKHVRLTRECVRISGIFSLIAAIMICRLTRFRAYLGVTKC